MEWEIHIYFLTRQWTIVHFTVEFQLYQREKNHVEDLIHSYCNFRHETADMGAIYWQNGCYIGKLFSQN